MPKSTKIKWRKSDISAARKAIKNFNAKIAYHQKKHPDTAGLLPEKISMKQLKQDITTRQDFNRKMKSLQNFSKRGSTEIKTNKQGEKALKWTIQETKKALQKINRDRQKEKEKLENRPILVNGKKLENAQRMSTVDKLKPLKFDFEKAKKGEFKEFAKWVEKKVLDKSKQKEADAFLKALKDTAKANLSKKDFDKINELYDKIGADKLLDLYNSGNDTISPQFVYEPIDNNDKTDRIISELEKELM